MGNLRRYGVRSCRSRGISAAFVAAALLPATALAGVDFSLCHARVQMIQTAVTLSPGESRVFALPRLEGEACTARGDLRLTIRGEQLPGGPAAAMRVFLDRPDAGLHTPLSDPHYVSSVAVFPEGRTRFALTAELSAAARRLGTDHRALRSITLVSLPADGGEPSSRIRIDSLRLEYLP